MQFPRSTCVECMVILAPSVAKLHCNTHSRALQPFCRAGSGRREGPVSLARETVEAWGLAISSRSRSQGLPCESLPLCPKLAIVRWQWVRQWKTKNFWVKQYLSISALYFGVCWLALQDSGSLLKESSSFKKISNEVDNSNGSNDDPRLQQVKGNTPTYILLVNQSSGRK